MSISTRDKIIESATAKFLQYGFSSVTTDEIAADLGISKKTLYQHFSSKRDILEAAVDRFTHETELQIKGITLDNSLEFTRKIELMLNTIATRLARVSQPFVRDIRRLAPDIWKKVEHFRRNQIISKFGEMFEEGIASGQVRSDIDPTILLLILTKLLDSVLNPEVLADISYSATEVFEALMGTFFVGILTPAGRDRYMHLKSSGRS